MYYAKLNGDNSIACLIKTDKRPTETIEISEEKYNHLLGIIQSVPARDNYLRRIKIFMDGQHSVEYEPITVEEVGE